jgi:hypothetical protein
MDEKLKSVMDRVETCMSELQEEIEKAQDIWNEKEEGPDKTAYQCGYSYRLLRYTEYLLDALHTAHKVWAPEQNQ